jgi:hypothetical protein
LAAVILRRTLGRFWEKIEKNHNDIKQLLLQRVTNEPERIVRLSLGELIIKTARLTLPFEKWNDLLPFLQKLTTSQFKEHRESAYRIYSGLFEYLGEELSKNIEAFINIFLQGMKDQEASVRVASLKAVNSAILWLEDENSPNIFKHLVEPMLSITIQCIQTNLISEAVDSLDIFIDLLTSPFDFLDPYLEQILKIMLQISANENTEFGVRSKSMLWIQNFAAIKPKTLANKGYIKNILQILFQVASSDSDSLDDTETSAKASIDTIDSIIASLPEKHVCPIAIQLICEYIKDNDEHKRSTALNVLSNAVKSSMNFFNDNLDQSVNLLITGLLDPSPIVRTSAGICMVKKKIKYLINVGQKTQHF